VQARGSVEAALLQLTHLYLRSSLKSVCAVFLSSVLVKRLSAGGTFSRWFSTRRCRWMRTYLGHFTKRCRSRFGCGAAPTPAAKALRLSSAPSLALQAAAPREPLQGDIHEPRPPPTHHLVRQIVLEGKARTKGLRPLLEERVDRLRRSRSLRMTDAMRI